MRRERKPCDGGEISELAKGEAEEESRELDEGEGSTRGRFEEGVSSLVGSALRLFGFLDGSGSATTK
jgi:hypothetical protein